MSILREVNLILRRLKEMKRKWIFISMLSLIILTLMVACDKKVVFVGSSSSTENKTEASYSRFTGTEEKKISLKNGETLAIEYQSEVEEGELAIKLYDPDNQLLQSLSTNKSGNEKVGASKDGVYRIEIKGNKTKGSYRIEFKIE
jgi:methionine-rich copper-binding protein CopC